MNKNIDFTVEIINECSGFIFNRSLLIAILKAFHNQAQLINDKKRIVFELQNDLIYQLENDEQKTLLYAKNKKLAVRLRKLIIMTDTYYDNYTIAVMDIAGSNIILKQMKLKLYEDSKQDITLLKHEINSLVHEINIVISHIDGYRNSYKAIKKIVASPKIAKNKSKKKYYDNLLETKEQDYLVLGRFRKSLVKIEKALQEQDHRWNGILMKLNSVKEQKR